ncbi:zincin-like metallopeptidase domain-containing protein [Prevotella sp. HJM029]|uniref:zincin-like metallopeptidase domain-containing protein n=1 Tax=Prevotella sp. HJM029 TaxID=1433844 RepID=UPI00048C41DB|nr:ArdC-like ssDNA-binding domain-containing protein [Prevotella sp. HJM029]
MAETEYKQRNSSAGRKNKSDEILKKFADMMIKIIKKANANNWKKGWMGVNGSIQGLPQNISSRTYSGGNSFFLMFNTAEKGYKTPVYMTFKQAKEQNLHVKSGEKSVPIFKWGLSIKDENGKRVSEEDYNAMSQEERATMDVRPFPKMFHVFNIDQTNLEEVNKKRYDAIVARFQTPEQEVKDTEGMYVNEALDRMFEQKAWHANIQYDKPADQALYRPSTDTIVLPMKEQFKLGKTPEEVYHDGMEYYSTALHEMAHSTGHESRLDRKFGAQGTDNYAHEELIAEMTSALVGSTMGFDRKILKNNANYLSGWLSRLRDKPETITTIMTDVGKASDMIIEKVDEQRIALNQTPLKAGNLDGLDEELGETKRKGKTLYDLTEQWRKINAQYPFSVDDERTRQIAKRIRQAEQVITAYNANVAAAYGDEFLFSEKAKTAIIPHAVYSGHEQPPLEIQRQAVASEPENQNVGDMKEQKAEELQESQERRVNPDRNPINSADDYDDFSEALAEGLGIEKSREDIQSEEKPSLTFQEEPYSVFEIENAVAYGTISKLEYIQMIPLEGIKERYNSYCNQHKIDSQREESAVAFLDYVKYNNLSAKWWPETSQPEEVQENVSLSEDSNPKTNLAGVAEHIMETNHVSKGEAEKMAAPIVEEQQTTVNEKKQKAAQAKQEAVKKADEARKAEDERRREVEEQRRREEENRKNDKDGGQASKIFLHAALLLGALELAKGNKGVWMNKAGKSNAEFLWAKTPITPYNNLMMNLQSDQKGYRSNVYAYFDELKDAGDSVRSNEKALPFNWTRWNYQNIATKEVITKGEYQKLPEDEKSLYVKHHSRQTLQIFNIDQTSMTGKQMYGDLLKETGAKYEELSERGVTSMIKFSEKLKSNHPTAIVVARDDNQYHIYGNDATRAGKILGLPVGQTEVDGKKIKSTGFPLDRIDDYLPKLVQAKQWVVVADNLDSAELIRRVANEKDVLNKAYSTAQTVAKSAGIGYERVMVLQDAEYDKQADKIIVSGMTDKDSGNSRQAAIAKANDIYRAIVAATGSEQRLDRMGRNNLLPNDDAKYERFVQDLSAGILMARQGLPASLSKESMQHIDYWQREIKENPKLLGLLEKDVNNAVESIDKHMQKQIVKYEDIRKDLPLKDLAVSERQYQISTDLAKLPDIDSKEIVIVRDTAKGSADVILPEGASLEDNVEISGIRKDRIKIALGHEGITDVKFYNAGGALGLKEPDDYYKDKTVSVDRLRQYEFSQHRDIDVKPQIAAAALPKIEIFTPIRDEKGQYAFFFKAENEPSFSVYPNDTHKKLYFEVRGTDKQKEIHNALAQKYYSVAKQHPEIKVDLIMPKVSNVDMSKIDRPTITKDREDPSKKYVMATIDGKFMKKEITKSQWDKMWLADDMSAYKKAVAAVVFAPLLKEDVQKEQSTSMAARSTSTETVKKEQGAEEKTAEGTSDSISETATEKEAETTRRESTFRR